MLRLLAASFCKPLKINESNLQHTQHIIADLATRDFDYLIEIINLKLAGAGGIEPPNGGIKIRCLTAWLRPKRALL